MRRFRFLVVLAVVIGPSVLAPAADKPQTKVVILGSGTPRPFPDHSGPAVAIVVGDRAYLVDVGPGVVRRAMAAFEQGNEALNPAKLTVAFITHLHSDHTAGLPDLVLIPWVIGRSSLDIYGPAGTEEMTRHVLAGWHEDIEIRTKGLEHRGALVVHAHDAQPGTVYKDDRIAVTAFRVPHGEWPQAFGYRFVTADRTIVISGDTSPSQELISNCDHCDVLIHETYSPASTLPNMPNWNTYRAKYHTSTAELGSIAARAKPGVLIVYHISGRGTGPFGRSDEKQILDEIQQVYKGKVVIGHDLETY